MPPHCRYFSLAPKADLGFWKNDDEIREQMELEAHNRAMVNTILHKIKAQRCLVAREQDIASEILGFFRVSFRYLALF